MMKFHRGRGNMTINGHEKGSSVSHNKMEENSEEIGIKMKRMIQEEFDREMTEMKGKLCKMMILL